MKTVLITGASSGIGKAYAKRFAKEGYKVILVSRRQEKLEEVAAKLNREYKVETVVIPCDLSEDYAANRLCDELSAKNLVVDVLVNNAGFATKGRLDQTDFEKQHHEINVNVTALTELTYLIIGGMVERKAGVVINISSAAGFNPVPYSAVYAATKAYVLSFSQSLTYEYKDKGVKVMVVCPEATKTHFFDEIEHLDGPMRKPEDVVNTTFIALKRNKMISTDGVFCYLQSIMGHFLSRKMILRITGGVGKKIWG